ncbi:MAG TPA: hypothetical protein PLL26_02170 [Candidatus Dojkabacteria bacterium]|nr:hypothetical protein [Candidatus Dojkabacteria bacterium]
MKKHSLFFTLILLGTIVISCIIIKNDFLGNTNFPVNAYIGGLDESLCTEGGACDEYDTGALFDTGNEIDDFSTVIAVDSENRYYIAGHALYEGYDYTYSFLCRILENGQKDVTFGEDGCAREISIKGTDGSFVQFEDILMLDNGKILLLGFLNVSTGGEALVLLQLNSDGSIDSSFGDGSCRSTDPTNPENGCSIKTYSITNPIYEPSLTIREANNKYYILSPVADESSVFSVALWRFNVDGTLDSSFGDSTCPNAVDGCFAYQMGTSTLPTGMVNSSDHLYISSIIDSLSGYDEEASYYGSIMKVNFNGTLDESFGDGSCINGVGTDNKYGCIIAGGQEVEGSEPGKTTVNLEFQSIGYDRKNDRLVVSGILGIKEQVGDEFWDIHEEHVVMFAYNNMGQLALDPELKCTHSYGEVSSCIGIFDDTSNSKVLVEETCAPSNLSKSWCQPKYLVLYSMPNSEAPPSLAISLFDTSSNNIIDVSSYTTYYMTDFNRLSLIIDSKGNYVVSSLRRSGSDRSDADCRLVRYKNVYQIKGLADTFLYIVDKQDISEGTQYGSYGDVGVHVSLEGEVYFNTLLQGPGGIALDSDENVYVHEMDALRIQKFNKEGDFITSWGSEGTGDGQLENPPAFNGIDVSSQDLVYVLDTGNYRVQVFDQDGNFIRKWSNDTSEEWDFISPAAISLDNNDNVYIFDSNFYGEDAFVLKFDKDGNFLRKFDVEVDDWLTSIREAGDIFVDSEGYIYLTETQAGDAKIVILDSDGVQQTTIYPGSDVPLEFISSIFVKDGVLFVTDREIDTIFALDPYGYEDEGRLLYTIGEPGIEEGQFSSLHGIAISESSGNIYTTEYYETERVQKFSSDGSFVQSWGNQIERKQFL